MDCPNCGLRVPEGTARCPNCLRAMPRSGLLQRLARALGLGGRSWPSMQVTNRTTEIRTRIQVKDGRSGETKTYSSLADAPAEIRQQMEQAKAGDALTKITVRDASGVKRTEITVKDASGVIRTYESIDQLPPDIRALYERALK
jgi:hypothetical protein